MVERATGLRTRTRTVQHMDSTGSPELHVAQVLLTSHYKQEGHVVLRCLYCALPASLLRFQPKTTALFLYSTFRGSAQRSFVSLMPLYRVNTFFARFITL